MYILLLHVQPSPHFLTLHTSTHEPKQSKIGREDLAREALRGLQLVQPHPMMWAGLGLLLEEQGAYLS